MFVFKWHLVFLLSNRSPPIIHVPTQKPVQKQQPQQPKKNIITPHCQGALLLVLFRVAHAVEHTLTHQARGNLTALVAGMPTTALLVAINADTHHPDVHSAREVLAKQVAVGSTVLVRPGTQV